MPKISVIIPAYNCEKLISTAIESVLNQTYKDYELIVVDDGSTDNSAKAISQYASLIKYIYQPNGGPGKARNTGILNAQGEYIAFLDQDDAWLADKLKMQVELLENNKKIGLVYTDAYILDNKRFLGQDFKGLRNFQRIKPYRGNIFLELFLDNFIATPSVMVRKECFSRVGLFNHGLNPADDYDKWLRIAAIYEVDYIDKALVKHRDHPACFTRNQIETVTNIINTLNEIIKDYPLVKEKLAQKANKRIAYFYIVLGKLYLWRWSIRKAFYNFSSALKLNSSAMLPFYILFSFAVDSSKRILRNVRKTRNE